MFVLWDATLETDLDERPRSLLKTLLDEATQQPPIHSHAKIFSVAPTPSDGSRQEAPKLSPSPPPAANVTRMEPPRRVESGGYNPVIFLAKPPCSESGRPTKQKRSDHIRHPRSRGRHNRQTGVPPPPRRPGSPIRKPGESRNATAPDTESSPGRALTCPVAATIWAIVLADPAQAAVPPKRSRLEAVGLPTKTPDRTPKGNQLKSESTRIRQRADRIKTELGSPACSRRGEERVHVRRRGSTSYSRGPNEPRRPLRTVRDGRSRNLDFQDQTAKIAKQKKPPDQGFPAQIARSSSAKDCPDCTPPSKGAYRKRLCRTPRPTPDQTARHRRPMYPKAHPVPSTHQSRPRQRESSPRREPSSRTSWETSRRNRSSTTPPRGASSSGSGCCSSGAAPPRKPRRGAEPRQGPVGPAAPFDQGSVQRAMLPTRFRSSPELMIPRKKPPVRRPIVAAARSKATESTAVAKGGHRNRKAEKKDGRLRRLKDRLGLIFYHHHHHYHHHHPPSDPDEYGGRGRRKHRQHRSLGELLRGILHHKGGKQGPAEGSRRPPQQGPRHGYLHMLLEGLLRHLWRRPRRRNQRPPQPGGAAGRVTAKKLHWWQKIRRRRRGLRLGSRRRPRLRLGFGRKASVGRGGGNKKK